MLKIKTTTTTLLRQHIPSGPRLLPFFESVVYFAENRLRSAEHWSRVDSLFLHYTRFWQVSNQTCNNTVLYATTQKTFASLLKKYGLATNKNWTFSYRPEAVVYGVEFINKLEV